MPHQRKPFSCQKCRTCFLRWSCRLTRWRTWVEWKLLVDLLEPEAQTFKTLAVGDVVDHHDAVCSSALEVKILVVGGGDGAESVLSGCVPLLQTKLTICSLIFLPSISIFFIFWVNPHLRNRHQSCCKRQWWSCSRHNASACRIFRPQSSRWWVFWAVANRWVESHLLLWFVILHS